MPTERRRDAFRIVARAFDRQPLLVGIQRVRQLALKVQGIGEVLQRFALELGVADPPRDLAHALESHLRGGVHLRLRRLTRAPRQRGDELVRHEVGLRQQELLARSSIAAPR